MNFYFLIERCHFAAVSPRIFNSWGCSSEISISPEAACWWRNSSHFNVVNWKDQMVWNNIKNLQFLVLHEKHTLFLSDLTGSPFQLVSFECGIISWLILSVEVGSFPTVETRVWSVMQSLSSLLWSNVHSVCDQIFVSPRFYEIDFSWSRPRSVLVVSRQQPNGWKLYLVSDWRGFSRRKKVFTWPKPITSWHFCCYLNFSISEAEGIDRAYASTFQWVYDVLRISGSFATIPCWIRASENCDINFDSDNKTDSQVNKS